MNSAATRTAFLRKTSILAVAGALAMIGAAGSAAAAPKNGKDEYARGRIIVEARAGLSDAELDQIVKVHGGKGRKLGQSRLYVVDLPANASETAVAAQLAHRPELKFAELDRVVSSTASVNDPYLGNEWHLAKVGATSAWDSSQGAGVTIAVLDSGINVNHPDLKDRLVAGYNVYSGNTDLSDVCGHGTAVAGVAAASANNAIDGVTVASGSGGSLGYNWNSRKAGTGSHTIVATARDAAGNASSKSVSVTVR